MAAAEHKHPNYMAIFWYLAILTVVEIAVIYAPWPKVTIVVLLCSLALGKAVLVAMYFMHLRFETRTLGLVAITPLMIATLLVFLLLPDGLAVAKRTVGVKAAVSAPRSTWGRRPGNSRWVNAPQPPGVRPPPALRPAARLLCS